MIREARYSNDLSLGPMRAEEPTKGKWVRISQGIYRTPWKTYLARFRRGGFKKHGTFDRIKDAQAAWSQWHDDAHQHQYPFLKEDAKITLSAFIPIYIEKYAKVRNETTYNRVTQYILTRFKNQFGHVLLSDITPLFIDTYRAGRVKSEIEASTINRECAVLHHLLTQAVSWGLLREHNLGTIQKLEEKGGRLRYLTHDEYDKLLERASGKLRDIIILAVATGLRRSNIRRINMKTDVDFINNRIFLKQVKGHGKKVCSIPMNGTARQVLMRQTEEAPFDFDFSQAFETAVEKAGLPKKGDNRVTFHTLRHTFASWLVMNGVSLFDVQKLLLHSKIQTTMTYAHLAPDHLQDSMETIDRIFSKAT